VLPRPKSAEATSGLLFACEIFHRLIHGPQIRGVASLYCRLFLIGLDHPPARSFANNLSVNSHAVQPNGNFFACRVGVWVLSEEGNNP
jgi:hypothetical protein